jgi:ketosteroid isomerase-like protein
VSEENIEVVERAFNAWSERGLDGLREYLDADFTFHEDPKFPESGVYRGRDAFEAYAKQFLAVWETQDWQLEDAVAIGADKVLTKLKVTWRGEGSGVEVAAEPGWIWTIRNGRAVSCEAFLDRNRALEAVGLRE